MNFAPVRRFRPYIILFAAAAAILLFSRQFMVIRVEEESMTPTLAEGQWVLVRRGSAEVVPGDIAVFVSPGDSRLAVKRCILAGGDRPVVEQGWLVTPWGRWFLSGSEWSRLDSEQTIPEGSVYMVGDNQFRSLDSRAYGEVSRNSLIGKVLVFPGRRSNG